MAPKRICSVYDCDKPSRALGCCWAHYRRLRLYGDPLGGGTFVGAPLKWIFDHAAHVGDGCLTWPFSDTNRGYGRVYHDGRGRSPANFMCELVNGPPPSESHVTAHSCGKGHEGCIHPRHLRWATQKENSHDKYLHGTHGMGEQNPKAILTEEQARDVYRRAWARERQQDIADRYGIDCSMVSHIKSGRKWPHISAGLTPKAAAFEKIFSV